jgi:hypothetical protein
VLVTHRIQAALQISVLGPIPPASEQMLAPVWGAIHLAAQEYDLPGAESLGIFMRVHARILLSGFDRFKEFKRIPTVFPH